jgi:soluble lytic murein transglycosylase-like protein
MTVDELIATSPKARRFFPRNDEISDLFEFIVTKSEQYGVSPLLVLSLIEVESGFSPDAVSRRGAVGLMQLMPETAEEVAHTSGMSWRPELLNDPKVNIELGLRYMKMLKEQFKSVDKVLTAYNIGPAALQEKLSQGETVPLDYFYRVHTRFVSYRRNPRLPRSRSRHWSRAWL